MMNIVVAHYCQEESEKAGCTSEQIAAGRQLVDLAVEDNPIISMEIVAQTVDDHYRPWIRLSAPRFTCRAIVEVDTKSATTTLHVVLPRHANTYYDTEALWKQRRQPK
jgi:hypothetical protein